MKTLELNIMGKKYTIEEVDKITFEGREVVGLCDVGRGIIKINKLLSRKEKLITIIHEVSHALINRVSMSPYLESIQEEVLVDTLATTLVENGLIKLPTENIEDVKTSKTRSKKSRQE